MTILHFLSVGSSESAFQRLEMDTHLLIITLRTIYAKTVLCMNASLHSYRLPASLYCTASLCVLIASSSRLTARPHQTVFPAKRKSTKGTEKRRNGGRRSSGQNQASVGWLVGLVPLITSKQPADSRTGTAAYVFLSLSELPTADHREICAALSLCSLHD